MTQPDWSTRFARVLADEIRRYRQALGMSAQQLADATEAEGHAIPRSVLANLESGRRGTVSVPELIALARALRVSPIELVFPLGHAETVEILPGQHVPTWSAVKWFTAEGRYPVLPIPDLTVRTFDDRPESAIALHRMHDQRLAEWRRRQDQASIARLGLDNASPEETDVRKQVIAMAEDAARSEESAIFGIRQRMRRHGLIPPPIYDPRLAHIDGDER